jgi:hypothetical protein
VILWGFRAVIGLTLVVHITAAISLAVDKARARPVAYEKQRFVRATFADTQMLLGGIILFCFVVFHLANFTIHVAPQPFEEIPYTLQTPTGSIVVDDVYRMIVDNFQMWGRCACIWRMGFRRCSRRWDCATKPGGGSSKFARCATDAFCSRALPRCQSAC